MGDVDFCHIYLKKTKLNLKKSNKLFKNMFVYPVYWCSHYTNMVINMIQASSLYTLVIIKDKKRLYIN